MSKQHYETFLRNMETRRYAESTKQSYQLYLKQFERFIEIPLEKVEIPQVQHYLYYLSVEKKRSADTINMARSSLKFFFETVLLKGWNPEAFPRIRRFQEVPEILTQKEIERVINVTSNLKHKTILLVAYSAGLRINEVRKLQVNDIRSDINKIKITYAKGNKHRYAWLSQKALEMLRKYYLIYRPNKNGCLFYGSNKETFLSERTIQIIFQKSLEKASINKKMTFHSFRHSFATHLVENNTPLPLVKEALGHSSLTSTERYLHLADSNKLKYKNPADMLHLNIETEDEKHDN